MMIFDFFFYTVYRFLNRRLKRGKEDAKHSALCIELYYISTFSIVLACFIGTIYDNTISRYFLNNAFLIYIIMGIVGYIALRIRYYKIYDVEDIEKKKENISITKKIIYKWAIYSLLILVPILGFVFFRLYKFGYV